MSQLPNHFFVSKSDGALHDTRRANWHKHPLRKRYKWTHARISTIAQLKATLRAGEYAWPGGYPMYLYTRDSQALHFECVKKEFRGAIQSILWDAHDRIIGCEVNYENADLYCGYCGKQIESAYGEDEMKSAEAENDE